TRTAPDLSRWPALRTLRGRLAAILRETG
ncbi:MAG: hypothetical protein RIT14_255, partial [Pseudomonadota bacterium]